MKWKPFRFSLPRRLLRRPIRRVHLALEALESRLAPSANVLTFHNDIASTGLNPNENQLTPANVKVGSFGKLFVTPVDGQVYAEPLVYTGVTIANGVNTKPGAAGVHDVVFVATEHDSLYAIDASVAGGAVLWQRTFLDAGNPTGNINNTLGATALSSVPNGEVNTADINPEIGITGTSVIDPATATATSPLRTTPPASRLCSSTLSASTSAARSAWSTTKSMWSGPPTATTAPTTAGSWSGTSRT
jgi:hypothetical protein